MKKQPKLLYDNYMQKKSTLPPQAGMYQCLLSDFQKLISSNDMHSASHKNKQQRAVLCPYKPLNFLGQGVNTLKSNFYLFGNQTNLHQYRPPRLDLLNVK